MQGLPQQTCREFIAQNCKASVLRVFPGQLLDVRVDEVLEAAKAGDRLESVLRLIYLKMIIWKFRAFLVTKRSKVAWSY
jgi:hypothetical protein